MHDASPSPEQADGVVRGSAGGGRLLRRTFVIALLLVICAPRRACRANASRRQHQPGRRDARDGSS
jgi:hypothetical protein